MYHLVKETTEKVVGSLIRIQLDKVSTFILHPVVTRCGVERLYLYGNVEVSLTWHEFLQSPEKRFFDI